MADLRRNPITGHSVIIAENRGTRPREVFLQPVASDQGDCPFCEGQEQCTPGETLARRAAGDKIDGPGWRVRVIPNKYPAITTGESTSPTSGLFAHEVIIESPQHLTNTIELDEAQFAEVLDVYRERMSQLGTAYPQASVMIFKNNGPAAGATLAHLHSQLVASSLPTSDESTRLAAFLNSPRRAAAVSARSAPSAERIPPVANAHGSPVSDCPACEMITAATRDNRMVAESKHFVVLCPHASRLCYEMWLLPREHQAHYSRTSRDSLPELASLFRQALVKLERIVKVSAYNYIVHTAPFDTSGADHYHWHIEILPRITTLAGFELGTGCYINPVPPERAAAELRMA